jgi:glycerate kinase
MIIIAPDKFKGSLTSNQVCNILEKGLLKYLPAENIKKFPLSDGGDGFIEVVSTYTPGLQKKEMKISDPLMETEITSWYLHDGNSTAYIETAESSGLKHLKINSANPMNTSTFGLGQLIKDAIISGNKKIYIGLGGSSTTDGGIGVASALGFKFLDSNGNELSPVGKNLIKIKKIKWPLQAHDAMLYALTDVDNPLCGPNGSAHVFAAQKGASASDIEILDSGLKNLANIINSRLNTRADQIAGSGAAGGLAAGLYAFFNAELRDGSQFILDLSGIEDYYSPGSLLITGEGKIDDQTLMGKICGKIARNANRRGITVFGIAGINSLKKEQYQSLGFSRIYQLTDKNTSIQQAISNSENLLLRISEKIGKYLYKNPSIIQ